MYKRQPMDEPPLTESLTMETENTLCKSTVWQLIYNNGYQSDDGNILSTVIANGGTTTGSGTKRNDDDRRQRKHRIDGDRR